MDALPGPDDSPLHTAVRYGVSQAVLAAVAHGPRRTMAEVVRDEYDTGAPLLPVPLYAQTGDDRLRQRREDDPQGRRRAAARAVQQPGRELRRSRRAPRGLPALAGRADRGPPPRRPATGRGCTSTPTARVGLAFGGDTDAVAALPRRAGRDRRALRPRRRAPVDAGSRERSSPPTPSSAPTARVGSGVRIVVDEWCNTLDDVRRLRRRGRRRRHPRQDARPRGIEQHRRGAAAGPRRRAGGLLRRHLQRDRPLGPGHRARGDGLPGRARCSPSRAWAWTKDS